MNERCMHEPLCPQYLAFFLYAIQGPAHELRCSHSGWVFPSELSTKRVPLQTLSKSDLENFSLRLSFQVFLGSVKLTVKTNQQPHVGTDISRIPKMESLGGISRCGSIFRTLSAIMASQRQEECQPWYSGPSVTTGATSNSVAVCICAYWYSIESKNSHGTLFM